MTPIFTVPRFSCLFRNHAYAPSRKKRNMRASEIRPISIRNTKLFWKLYPVDFLLYIIGQSSVTWVSLGQGTFAAQAKFCSDSKERRENRYWIGTSSVCQSLTLRIICFRPLQMSKALGMREWEKRHLFWPGLTEELDCGIAKLSITLGGSKQMLGKNF